MELELRFKCAECNSDLEGRGVSAIDGDNGFIVRALPCETCVSAAEKGHMRENRTLTATEALEWIKLAASDLDPAELGEFLKGLPTVMFADQPVRMVETYEGTVEVVEGNSATVVYEIDGEPVDHMYERNQFVESRLPDKGARLVTVVHVLQLPPKKMKLVREWTEG